MNVKKLATGAWEARVKLFNLDYKKRFKTKGEASRWLKDNLIELSKLDKCAGKSIYSLRFSAVLQQYRLEITPSKKGARQENTLINRLLNHRIASFRIKEITPRIIAEWRNSRLKEVSAGTVIREMNLMSAIFNVARTEFGIDGLVVNPVQGMRRPKPNLHRDRRLIESSDELSRILKATDSQMLKLVLPFAIETGMRRGEIATVKKAAVSLVDQTIYLSAGNVKNGEGRTVPLSRAAVDIILQIPNHCSEFLFNVQADSISLAFRRAVARARRIYEAECNERGIRPSDDLLLNLHFHDMRHEAASRFFEKKHLSVMEVASITGHKDLRQLRRYTHLNAKKIALKLG